jgi:hypothetical protein
MNVHASLENDTFQKVLASAFAVQTSGLGAHLVSAVIEIQRSIKTGQQSEDEFLQIIAESAREIAGASGTAVAMLQGNLLVYRAGSGSARSCVGQQGIAVLSAFAPGNVRHEILRVENAQTDSRIESAVCRQLGAMSLLILPIYYQKAVAGVLQVFFNEAHVFSEQEVCAYRLMTGILEKCVFRDISHSHKPVAASLLNLSQPAACVTSKVPRPWTKNCASTKTARQPFHSEPFRSSSGSAIEIRGSSQTLTADTTASGPGEAPKQPLPDNVWHNLVPAGLAIVVCIFLWIAQHPVSVKNSTRTVTDATNARLSFAPSAIYPMKQSPMLRTPRQAVQRELPSSGFKRVRVSHNELDYIAEDVTIRHFTIKPPSRPTDNGKKFDIGEDVTVWHFDSQPKPHAANASPASGDSSPSARN